MEITVQTVKENGKKINESKLIVSDGELLTVILPDGIRQSQAQQIHNIVKDAIENKKAMMTVLEKVKFKVIKFGN